MSPFEFLCSFVSLVLNNTQGLLFKLLYHVLWVNKHLLNLNLKILWWYDEGNIVKKAWWSDGRTDGQTEWTYSQSCLVAAKKCQVKSGPSCGQQTFVLLYSLSFMISRRSRVGLFDFRALYKILLMAFHMCSIRRLIQAMAFDSMISANSIIFTLSYTLHLDICNDLPAPMTIQSGTLQIISSVGCRLIAN